MTGRPDHVGQNAVSILRYISKHCPAILETGIAKLHAPSSQTSSSIACVELAPQCLAEASSGNASVKLDAYVSVRDYAFTGTIH
jgi:hypothetical protein